MNEVRAYLQAQTKPVTADEIRNALCMSHERVYELLVMLEAMHCADVRRHRRRMAWVAV